MLAQAYPLLIYSGFAAASWVIFQRALWLGRPIPEGFHFAPHEIRILS